jgi:hypothetical protein
LQWAPPRNRLAEQSISDLQADCEQHGVDVIERVRAAAKPARDCGFLGIDAYLITRANLVNGAYAWLHLGAKRPSALAFASRW